MIKVIDFKKLTFFEYYDVNGEGKNKKNNKNNIKLLELGGEDKNWDEMSNDSVREMIFERQKMN